MASPLSAVITAQLVAERQRRLMEEADVRRRANAYRTPPTAAALHGGGSLRRYATRMLARLA